MQSTISGSLSNCNTQEDCKHADLFTASRKKFSRHSYAEWTSSVSCSLEYGHFNKSFTGLSSDIKSQVNRDKTCPNEKYYCAQAIIFNSFSGPHLHELARVTDLFLVENVNYVHDI